MRTSRREVVPLSEFARVERVSSQTVLHSWRETGRAPRLTRINHRYYVSRAAWAAWLERLAADRIRTGNSRLRAPIGTIPRTRAGKLRWPSPSLEGL